MSTESAKVSLPLSPTANAKATVNTCTAQAAAVQQAAAYATTPTVQAAVTDMMTAVGALQATSTKLDQVKVELGTLDGTQTSQLVTVRLKHDALETALNVASNGSPQAAQQWVGKVKTRALPIPVNTAPNPPEDPALRNVKKTSGTVKASCKAEQGAVCYLFQQGGDPAHPELWPAPAMANGSTYVVRNQPIGQTVYFRIAVVRRGSVQGQWSPILQVMVR